MARTINKAIILAAGRGSRLRGVLKGKPKPLLKIGDTTLIENLINNLKILNINKIIVVVGYKSQQIRNKLKNKVKFIYYPHYKSTNNLHTLLYVRKELNEPLLCVFSDVLFSKKILSNLVKRKENFVLAIDKKSKLSGT